MSLRAEAVTRNSPFFPQVKTLYEEAFPANERAPLSILFRKARKPHVDFVLYREQDAMIGFTYLARRDDLVFLMYLAVDPRYRSQGYGSRLLEQVRLAHPGCRIMLNIENVEPDKPGAEDRARRRRFYLRNGYEGSGFLVKEFGVLYEALVYGGAVEQAEFLRLYGRFMGFPLSVLARPKFYPSTPPRSTDA
ncbi:GNAT family N-acetyltransferase [Saccharibacillus sp. O23]|uniref:GNAT family N-acetyltransferase n=1 Tax=Saccharibacillus sp. O23 TaxID=2009338 RepID=UPI0015C648D5|nr:GNAT family N-acetyltransferase [Saccharibacillus sp. O23]